MQELQYVLMLQALVDLHLFLQLLDAGRAMAERRRDEEIDHLACGYAGVAVVDRSEYSEGCQLGTGELRTGEGDKASANLEKPPPPISSPIR